MHGMPKAVSSLAVVCFMIGQAWATVTYTYENDNKTYVAMVTDADDTMSADAAAVLAGNSVTNFILRGDKQLSVASGMASTFNGDIRIEGSSNKCVLNLGSSDALGVNRSPGTIAIQLGTFVPANNTTIAKDVAFGMDGSWNGRGVEAWTARSIRLTGKMTIGNRNVSIAGYGNSRMVLAGGIEGSDGYFYINMYDGSKATFENQPINLANAFYFKWSGTASYYDAKGFLGYYEFAVAGNDIKALGWQDKTVRYGIRNISVKTTVDWAFNKSNMKVYFENDGVFDLCGTSQRVGQLDVKLPAGNASVITNSLAAPATLYMGKMYGPDDSAPDIRFGGNLSVVFEGNINTTKVDHVMTAAGNLTVQGTGTQYSRLEFTENGSWPNATNVMVGGSSGKIAIANPNALGRRANVDLYSNSSLEIASGVTVNVRTLTVGGVQQPRGDYTFGSGTLRVSHPCGFQMCVR